MADEIENIAKCRKIILSPAYSEDELIPGVFAILGPSKSFYQKYLLASDKTPETWINEWNKPYVKATMTEDDYDPNNGEIEWFDEENTSEVNQTSLIILLEVEMKSFFLPEMREKRR